MKRRLLNFLSSVSIALCLAACILWARSWSAFDHMTWRYAVGITPAERDERAVHAVSVRGRLFFGRSRERYWPFPSWEGWKGPQPGPGVTWAASHERPGWANHELDVYGAFDNDRYAWRLLGCGVVRTWSLTNHGGPTREFEALAVPHGLVAAGLALPGLPWVAHGCRRRSRRPGLCRACGYDLRATPDRCPECGTAATGA